MRDGYVCVWGKGEEDVVAGRKEISSVRVCVCCYVCVFSTGERERVTEQAYMRAYVQGQWCGDVCGHLCRL